MGSCRDQRKSNVQPNLTSTLRAAQETGRLRPHNRSRTALLQTHDPMPFPDGNPPAGNAPALPKEEQRENENGGIGSGFFDCNICFEVPADPVLTPCGHLFCWPCIYQWLNGGGFHPRKCPVCMGNVVSDNVTPIYGRGSENPRAPERNPTRVMIPPRPSAQRVTIERRTPRRMFIPGASLRQRPFPQSSSGAGAGTGAEASLGPPVVDFIGVTAGPFPLNAGMPLQGPIYLHQPLDTALYFTPITPFWPQHYVSLIPGGGIFSTARNPHPPTAWIQQHAQRDGTQFVEPVLGVHDGLQEGLAEMMTNMEDNQSQPAVNAGTEEGGSGPMSIQLTVQPELNSLASSSMPGTHRGNTTPPRSVGEPSLLPPQKRRRF